MAALNKEHRCTQDDKSPPFIYRFLHVSASKWLSSHKTRQQMDLPGGGLHKQVKSGMQKSSINVGAFSKMLGNTKADVRQVPYCGRTDIRRHRTKFR